VVDEVKREKNTVKVDHEKFITRSIENFILYAKKIRILDEVYSVKFTYKRIYNDVVGED